jgi:hypothetical protein
MCVSECDREASIMRPWPTRDSCAMEKIHYRCLGGTKERLLGPYFHLCYSSLAHRQLGGGGAGAGFARTHRHERLTQPFLAGLASHPVFK